MPYAVDYYKLIGGILGQGGADYCIFPIGDPRFENAAHTTFLTTGSGALDGLTCTYSKDRTTFDLPTTYHGRGDIARTPLDGTDEEITIDDNATFTRALATASWGIRIFPRAVANQALMSKWHVGGNKEWRLDLTAAGKLRSILTDADDVGDAEIDSTADVALPANREALCGATYDGTANASGIDLYQFPGGGLVASTDTDDAGFISMRDVARAVEIGVSSTSSNNFNGWIYGSAGGPFFTHRLLTLQDWRAIDILQREALRDLPLINRMRGPR